MRVGFENINCNQQWWTPRIILLKVRKQEAQLPQTDRTTRYVSKFVLFFTRYAGVKGFKRQKWHSRTFVIQGPWWHSIGHIRFPIRWNLLDHRTVDAPSINAFKSRLCYIRDNRMGFLADVNLRSRSSGRELTFTFAICHRPSVCCLSSLTLVHPTQAVELFGNFFSPYDSPGTLLFWCQKSLVGTPLSP